MLSSVHTIAAGHQYGAVGIGLAVLPGPRRQHLQAATGGDGPGLRGQQLNGIERCQPLAGAHIIGRGKHLQWPGDVQTHGLLIGQTQYPVAGGGLRLLRM